MNIAFEAARTAFADRERQRGPLHCGACGAHGEISVQGVTILTFPANPFRPSQNSNTALIVLVTCDQCGQGGLYDFERLVGKDAFERLRVLMLKQDAADRLLGQVFEDKE